MWIAIVVIIIVVIAGVAYYLFALPPPATGTPISIFDDGSSCSAAGVCGFNPSNKTITSGTNIIWTNTGTVPHTVTACTTGTSATSCPNGTNGNLPSFASASGGLAHNEKYSFTFNTAGKYYYYCTFHPSTMHGTVVVS